MGSKIMYHADSLKKLGNRHLIVGAGGLQSGGGPEEIAPTAHIPSTQIIYNRMLAFASCYSKLCLQLLLGIGH